MRRQLAFSLVELLVVIAIIGAIVALLLPAVQSAREAARATQCKSQLKQLGLALHQYHDSHNVLPPGWLADEPLGVPGWGWTTHLLPYLEQKNLEEGLIHRELSISHDANQRGRETVLPLLLCPSDPAPKLFVLAGDADSGGGGGIASIGGGAPFGGGGGKNKFVTHNVSGGFDPDEDWGDEPDDSPADDGIPLFRLSRSNYVGVFGSIDIDKTLVVTGKDPIVADGAFFFRSNTRFAQVTDGLSNTHIIGERAAKRGGSLWQGVVNAAIKPIARIVGVADHPPNRYHHFDDFSSYHPSGLHFLHGDGSVSRHASSGRFSVFKAMSTIGGGETLKTD